EETAAALQQRALDYLEKQNAVLDARRRELGVEDGLMEVEGVTPSMAVALGEGGIKSLEDLAGCATDDLLGWTEQVNGERKRQPGILESAGLNADEANAIIMAARVTAGWIEAPAKEEEATEAPVA